MIRCRIICNIPTWNGIGLTKNTSAALKKKFVLMFHKTTHKSLWNQSSKYLNCSISISNFKVSASIVNTSLYDVNKNNH